MATEQAKQYFSGYDTNLSFSANEGENDFSKIVIREEYFKAIWKEYMIRMNDKLSTEEKNHIIDAGKFMTYMQAIRSPTDYLTNDIY